MSISVGDAISSFKIPILMGVMVIFGFGIGYLINYTFFSDRSPVQPINFSHKIHVTDNNIQCMHCHAYVDKTPSAGVPSVKKCMGCHKAIATDKPEIIKLTEYWDKQEPIPWIKVHDVPDFVYFTHKRHIKAGIECQTCHGPIETMARVTRVSSLKMPWCVDCHTEKQVENGRDCVTCHK